MRDIAVTARTAAAFMLGTKAGRAKLEQGGGNAGLLMGGMSGLGRKASEAPEEEEAAGFGFAGRRRPSRSPAAGPRPGRAAAALLMQRAWRNRQEGAGGAAASAPPSRGTSVGVLAGPHLPPQRSQSPLVENAESQTTPTLGMQESMRVQLAAASGAKVVVAHTAGTQTSPVASLAASKIQAMWKAGHPGLPQKPVQPAADVAGVAMAERSGAAAAALTTATTSLALTPARPIGGVGGKGLAPDIPITVARAGSPPALPITVAGAASPPAPHARAVAPSAGAGPALAAVGSAQPPHTLKGLIQHALADEGLAPSMARPAAPAAASHPVLQRGRFHPAGAAQPKVSSAAAGQHAEGRSPSGRFKPLEPGCYCSVDWTQQWTNSHVHVLRSVGEWSAGTRTENSIFHAYVHAILNSRHSIHIEQQYLLSSLGWHKDELMEVEVAAGSTEHQLRPAAPEAKPAAAGAGEPELGAKVPVAEVDPRWQPRFMQLVEAVQSQQKPGGAARGPGAPTGPSAGGPARPAKALPPGSKWATLRGSLHQLKPHNGAAAGGVHDDEGKSGLLQAAHVTAAAAPSAGDGVIEHHARGATAVSAASAGTEGSAAPAAAHGRGMSVLSAVARFRHSRSKEGPEGSPAHSRRATSAEERPHMNRSMMSPGRKHPDLRDAVHQIPFPHPHHQPGPSTAGLLGQPRQHGRTGAPAGASGTGGAAGIEAAFLAALQQGAARTAQRRASSAGGGPGGVRPSSAASGSAQAGAGGIAAAGAGGGAAPGAPGASGTPSRAQSLWHGAFHKIRSSGASGAGQGAAEAQPQLSRPPAPGSGSDGVQADAAARPSGAARWAALRAVPPGRPSERAPAPGEKTLPSGVTADEVARATHTAGSLAPDNAFAHRAHPAGPIASPKGAPIRVGELGREKAAESSMGQAQSSLCTFVTSPTTGKRASALPPETDLSAEMAAEDLAAARGREVEPEDFELGHPGRPEAAERQPLLQGAQGAAGSGGAVAETGPRQPMVITQSADGEEVAPLDETEEPAEADIEWDPEAHGVAEALYYRLYRAIKNEEDFKACIILPVHPDGPIRTVRAIQLVLHWQCRTISRGGYSLLERLARRFPGVDLSRYIVFCALRNYDKISGQAVTEQIYVHSKLMIVDDRLVIIGSANLNNRSMFGDRDSEMAMIITGGDRIATRMAGKPWTATVFAHTLRRNLWEEHVGITHTCPHYARDAVGNWARMAPQVRAWQEDERQRRIGKTGMRMDNAHLVVSPVSRALGPAPGLHAETTRKSTSRKHSPGPTGRPAALQLFAGAGRLQQLQVGGGGVGSRSLLQGHPAGTGSGMRGVALEDMLLPRFVHEPLEGTGEPTGAGEHAPSPKDKAYAGRAAAWGEAMDSHRLSTLAERAGLHHPQGSLSNGSPLARPTVVVDGAACSVGAGSTAATTLTMPTGTGAQLSATSSIGGQSQMSIAAAGAASAVESSGSGVPASGLARLMAVPHHEGGSMGFGSGGQRLAAAGKAAGAGGELDYTSPWVGVDVHKAEASELERIGTLARQRLLRTVAASSRECACDAFADPADTRVFEGVFKAAAAHNTAIFSRVFPGIMQDDIKTMEEWQRRDAMPPQDESLLRHLVGHIVYWPKDFLSDVDLGTKRTEKEHYMPQKIVQ